VITYVFVMTDGSAAWDLLGDASRRSIVEHLAASDRTVSELAAAMPITRPAVSQHLRVLKDAGIVRDRQVGRTNVYSLDAHRLAAYRRQLDDFWTAALGRLATTEESTDDGEERDG
jgi:DNA-binding transcriptional ArsR family regulator